MRLSLSRAARRGAVSVAVVALVAACGSGGSGGSGGSSGGDSGDRLTPVAAVRGAADTTAEAGSSRFDLTVSTQVQGQSIEFSGTGLYDPEARKGSASFELPNGLGTMEQRFIGDDLYLAVPGQPGFYQVKLSDLVGTQLESAANPTGGADALKAVSDDVEEVGAEDVRGESTTHYRGTLDADQALDKLGGAVGEEARKALGKGTTIPFDAWIDDEGRLRKMTTTVDLPASEATQGQAVKATTTIEIYDFGVEVDVEPPPAGEIQDGGPLVDALRGETG